MKNLLEVVNGYTTGGGGRKKHVHLRHPVMSSWSLPGIHLEFPLTAGRRCHFVTYFPPFIQVESSFRLSQKSSENS
jgi:hypothetical protein